MSEYTTILENLNIAPEFHKEIIGLDSDIRSELFELIENIDFLSWLVTPKEERGFAKDKEKDAIGRIKVDITKLHVLEDMDFFRQRAIYFQKHGKYTHLYPNRHPNSEYMKFWEEELRRCLEGYVRESDGEWIPGYYYFYLNYSPIERSEDILNPDGTFTGRAKRVYDFVDIWDSDYMFFHYIEQAEVEGLFMAILKCRGRGYSFKAASMFARNYFCIKKSKSYAFASDSEFLEDAGLLDNKTWDVLDWVDTHTAWTKSRLKDSRLHKTAGYIDPADKKQKGYKSQIMGVTTANNPEKGRGKRGKLIIFEEGGLYPHLLRVWAIARASLEDGNSVFGQMMIMGTGGTENANFSGLEELFYRGGGYRVKMMRNIFDKVKGNGESALFIPEYVNRKNCYDKNGNSNPVKALNELLTDRKRIRLNASDAKALTQEKAERPITPQEAVLRFEGSIFPVADLKSYLEHISPNIDSFVSEHYIGDLVGDPETSEVKFKPNADAKPIHEFPLKDNKNKEGAFEIYQLPKKNGAGVIPRFRYIAGIDTYDDDESGTNSLGSILVMDMLTDEIVAEYTGRPKTANGFYERCYKLLKFYNAIGNYENNKKGLFAYFSHKHALTYLADVPEILKDMDMAKGLNSGGNSSKGTNAVAKVNAWGRRLQADWQLSPVEGQEETTGLLQLQRIRSVGYLKECIAWNEDINADRVSAGGMLMILREEYKKYVYHVEDKYNNAQSNSLANDPFFEVNYQSDNSKFLATEEGKAILNSMKYKLNLNEI